MARQSKSEYITALTDKAVISYNNSKNFFQQVDEERRRGLAYYMQLAQGNEVEGFSSFITSDVRDTANWYLAQLLEMFYAGDAPVRFDPRNEADAQQADIETEYVNDVIKNKNNGFLLLSNWFLDALLMKNGIVKCFWDDKVDQVPEDYEGKSYAEYSLLLADKDYTIKRVTVRSTVLEGTFTLEEFTEAMQGLDPMTGLASVQEARFDIKGTRKADLRQVRIENCQPENFFVDTSWTSLDLNGCPYVGYRAYRTRADLISDGYNYDDVMELQVADLSGAVNYIAATRYEKDTGRLLGGVGAQNVFGQYVEFVEHYIMDVEAKEPKLWCIKTGNNGAVIFDAYEIDRMPFHVITPKINPYRFYGDSVADELIDIQYHRSNLYRGAFDNIKYTIAPQRLVRGDVDIDALNDVQPLQTVTAGPDGSVEMLTTPFVAAQALEFAGLLEQMRAERTGFSKETAGLDPKALADSTNMMGGAILNLSQTRVKFVASCFASTGYKSLCEHIRELLLKYEDRDVVFNMAGKYMTVSPRSWFQSRSTTVRAGLGVAGRMEMQSALQGILALQEKIATAQGGLMGPLVNLENVYNAITRNLESYGIKDVSAYFTSPEGYTPPPPQPSLQELQMQSYERVEVYKADKTAETKKQEIETDAQVKIYEINQDTLVKEREIAMKYQEAIADDLEKAAAKITPQIGNVGSQ